MKFYDFGQDTLSQLNQWQENRRFDLIAKFFGRLVQKLCPFHTKEAYDAILIGSADAQVRWKGFLGWNIIAEISAKKDLKELSVDELKRKIQSPITQQQLEELFNLSQEYLILPMMNILFENGDKMFQNQINKHLNLDKLDGNQHQGWITAELFQRLCSQGIMKKIKKRVYGLRGTTFHIKQKPHMDYQLPIFVMPSIGFSKGHQTTLRVLQNFMEKVLPKTLHGSEAWKITNEYKNPYKHGFPRHMRYDIALWINGVLYRFIEFDGPQHHKYVPLYHGKNRKEGIKVFISKHLKDRIKDGDALKLCNETKCLRISSLNSSIIKRRIAAWYI